MKYTHSQAISVAEEILDIFSSRCSRIVIAGSLRRQAPEVSDIELLYIPQTVQSDPDLFGNCQQVNLANDSLEDMLQTGFISQRLNTRGQATWGEKNKLAIHTKTGIPVDFFATTADCWWNYLVCRTGPAESNIRIASIAKARGYQWNPYGPGFTRLHDGNQFPMTSEEAVFDFVGLPGPSATSVS